MPPQLPDRYQLEVRLGRHADIEEWLATDVALDRPVLIRVLGPETSEERRRAFLESVRGAAAIAHTHIASIYAADALPDGAYSISEWAGGLTLRHRQEAGDTLPVGEFLPNAAGLAEALAALHARRVVHGSIDESSVLFSIAHPAKLAGFGGEPVSHDPSEDVRNLADTLARAVTGSSDMLVAPSQVVDGLSPGVDRILDRARTGVLDASGFAEQLRAAPSSAVPDESRSRPLSWKWVLPALSLLVVALVLFIVGRSLDTGDQDAVLFPISPSPTVTVDSTTTTSSAAPEPASPAQARIVAVEVFDPEGDGAEHNREIPNLTDGVASTSWSTERYNDPLPLIKAGVGFTVQVVGAPGAIELSGAADGTSFRLLWADERFPTLAGWEPVARGSVTGNLSSIQLPTRNDGYWLVWLTDLPADSEGGFVGRVGEVRFRS